MAGLRAVFLLFAVHLSQIHARFEDYTPDNFVHFVTTPDIAAAKWIIDVYEPDALQQDHYWFLAPYAKLEQTDFWPWNGPQIYDMHGQLIYSGASIINYNNAFDFRVSRVDGEDMLSFSSLIKGPDNGYIFDNTYNLYESVDMQGNTSRYNMHDLNLINDGKTALVMLITEYDPTHLSVDDFEGPCKIGWQGFKEVDVKTGEVLFEWHSKDYISIEETTYIPMMTKDTWEAKCATNWDITHFNSIDKFPDGDYLLSSRHTDTLYKISHTDHSIVWRLGGRTSDFISFDERTTFTRQHHSRVRGQNETHIEISLFDNAVGTGNNELQSSSESWGLHIALRTDVEPMEVSLIHRYEKPTGIQSVADHGVYLISARGSMDFLPNGNIFMGWAVNSLITEHRPDGKLLMKASLVQHGADTYRAYKMPWKGYPSKPPAVVSRVTQRPNGNLTTTVYVSWNGATEVATWDVLHTNRFGNITELIASSPRQGFETKLVIDGFAKEVIAVGMDINGHELGRSAIIHSNVSENIRGVATAAEEQEWIRTHQDSWWQAPENNNTFPTGGEWFILGLFCSIGIVLAVIPLLRRQRNSWMGSLRFSYKNVAADEEELADREQLLDGKDRKLDLEECEEPYSPTKNVT